MDAKKLLPFLAATLVTAIFGCSAPMPDDAWGANHGGTGNSGRINEDPNMTGVTLREGDMLFSNGGSKTIAAGVNSTVRRWPGGVIPYELAPDLPKPERVTEAAKQWFEATGIRFVPRANEPDYVRFVSKVGCSSFVGKLGGKQDLDIVWKDNGGGCPVGHVLHEMGHAIGLAHEQTRSDRDDHIIVLYENIEPANHDQFTKTNFQAIGDYDIHSIMQYPSSAFATDGKPAMTTKDGQLIDDPERLSPKDIAGVREYYAKELKGETSEPEKSSVALSWSKRSATATYSVDVQNWNDRWTAPCLDAAYLQRDLKAVFTGQCVAGGQDYLAIDDVKAFRLCWAENGDWARAQCIDKPYTGQATLVLDP